MQALGIIDKHYNLNACVTGGKAKAKPKAAGSKPKGSPLSDVNLAGKTVEEKVSVLRGLLS